MGLHGINTKERKMETSTENFIQAPNQEEEKKGHWIARDQGQRKKNGYKHGKFEPIPYVRKKAQQA